MNTTLTVTRCAAALFALAVVSAAVETQAGVDLLSQSPDVNVTIVNEGSGSLSSGELTLDYSPGGFSRIRGRQFESFLIKIDNFESCSTHTYDAAFEIDAPVIGIQTQISSLRAGREVLGQNGFTPGAPGGAIGKNDTVTVDGNLVVSGSISNGTDPIRVFVEATPVPELASLAVWSTISVAGFIGTGRSRRR